jgi:hypothetical protein
MQPQIANELPEKITNLIAELRGANDTSKFHKIMDFIDSDESLNITSDNLVKLIKETNINNEETKSRIIGSFVTKSSEITSDDVCKMISEAGIGNEDKKESIIKFFIEGENSSKITSDDVCKMISEAGIGNEDKKQSIIESFIAKSSEITSDDVCKMISEAGIEEEYKKQSIIESFIGSGNSSKITSDDVCKMISEAGIEDENSKELIISHFFLRGPWIHENHDKDNQDIVDDFIKIIEKTKLKNIESFVIIYCNAFVPETNPLEITVQNFIQIIKKLHPDEATQCKLVTDGFDCEFIKIENFKYFKPFIDGLEDDKLALDLLETFSNKFFVNNIDGLRDAFDFVRGRTKKQYAFLAEVVSGEPIKEFLIEDGLEILKSALKVDLSLGENPATISELISFFDLQNQTSTLSNILKPEFKKRLRDSFAPSPEMFLYKLQELEKLNSLLGQEGIEFDVKSHFVENAKLCEFLLDKVGNILEIDDTKTYQINFANLGFEYKPAEGISEEIKIQEMQDFEQKKQQINTSFNEILRSSNPQEEKVEKFFSELFGVGFSEEDSDKLKVFFQQNKKEIAHCFCNETMPMENFTSMLTTLRDGCFSNIGTQFLNMLYGAMIKDEDARILYGVTSSKIIASIGANQGITHDGPPLNNAIINSYYASPSLLLKQITQEEMLTPEKSWEIIGKIVGDENKDALFEKLLESYPDLITFNQKAKEITSYLIIKTVVGEEKMKDLESKNTQFKELGDFIPDPKPNSQTQLRSSDEISRPAGLGL